MAVKSVKKVTDTKIEQEITEIKKPKRVKIDKDLEVLVMNNTTGTLVYVDRKSGNTYEMSGFGGTEYFTVDELRVMKNTQNSFFENYWIIPVEVDDDEIEIEDVMKYLGLEEWYKDAMLKSDVDNLLIKMSIDKFDKVIDNLNQIYVARITERAVELYRQKKFNDMYKMKTLERKLNKEDLFVDIVID